MLTHVEARAARLMRLPSAPSQAEVVVNNPMCGWCRDHLREVLPAGKTVRVFVRRDDGELEWVDDFKGNGRALT